MKTIYIVIDVELGWDSIIFVTFNKEEAQKCKEDRGSTCLIRERVIEDKYELES